MGSVMSLKKHLRLDRPSNNSPGFIWEQFDFDMCDNFESSTLSWAVCTMMCFAVGFPACVVILWDMFKTHSRGTPFTPNGFLILNLCIMDVFFLLSIPPGLLNHLIWKYWAIQVSWNGAHALNTCGRPLMMTCICLDCYLAVVHPIVYHKTKSLTPRVVMVGIVWAVTVAYGIVYILYYGSYFTLFAVVPFIVAIIIIGVSNSFIFYTLFKSHPGKNNIHPQKQRAVQTLTNSLVVSLLSYFPPVLLMVIGKPLSSNVIVFTCILAVPLNVTASLGSAVMPLLHLNNYGRLDRFKLGYAGILNSYKVRCCKS